MTHTCMLMTSRYALTSLSQTVDQGLERQAGVLLRYHDFMQVEVGSVQIAGWYRAR
jgi:hypothetical protein